MSINPISVSLLPGFNPTQISGCQLWLDAADITTIVGRSPVTSWIDKSGNANNATATGRPILTVNAIKGRQAIRTSTTPASFFRGSLSITGTSFTCFSVAVTTVVLPKAAGTSDQRLVSLANIGTVDFSRQDSAIALFNQVNTSTIATWRFGLIANNAIVQNTPFLAVSQYNGATGALWFNGSPGTLPSSASTQGAFTIQRYGVGNQAQTGATEYWNGFIGEVIIYNSAITAAQRQQVEGYLAWKWGLVADLPSSHPYKNTPLPQFPPLPPLPPLPAYPIVSVPTSVTLVPAGVPYTNKVVPNVFSPRQISGCQLWFDAADTTSMLFSGSTVTRWNDKSGNGRNATNGSYAAPTYSATGFNGRYPGLLFDGSTTMLNTTAFLPTPVLSANGTDTSIFVVFNYNLAGGNYGVYGLGFDNNAYVLRTPWNVGTFGTAIIDTASYFTSRISFEFTSTQAAAQLYSILRSGASHFFYQFGSLTASNLSSTGTVGTNSQTFGIGGGIADGVYFNSFISEMIIYNVALTTIQRQEVEGYLAWKWGLQGSLPANHPYKLFSPPPR
jgi:hypothetical protein